MSFKRFSQLLLVVLALALWAGTANAQIAVNTPTAFSYTQGSGSNTPAQTLNITDTTAVNTYSESHTPVSGGAWLLVGTGTGTTPGSTPDAVQLSVDASVAQHLGAGAYTTTVSFTGTLAGVGTDVNTVTFTVTLNVTSPLTAGSATSTALTFVTGAGSSQALASSQITVTNTTDASYDLYTVLRAATCPAFLLSTTGAPGTLQAKTGTPNTLTMSINTAGAAAAISYPSCNIQLQYNSVTFATVTFVSVSVVSQPLLATGGVALSWNKSAQTGVTATTITVKSPAGTTPIPQFSLDLATLPPWLTVTSGLSANSASASIAGNAVNFGLVTGVATGMPTGNYSQSVGFYTGTYGDLYVTVSLQISNAVPALTTNFTGTSNYSLGSSASAPTPSVTIFSSNEPAPFIATCTAAISPSTTFVLTGSNLVGCSLNGTGGLLSASGNVVNGTAFTWGYTMTANLDPNYFPRQSIGNVITVTIHFSGTNSTAPADVLFAYQLQPGIPTINALGGSASGLVPASVAAHYPTTQSLLVLVQGTNFVTPGMIVGSVVQPTYLWLGATKLDNSTNIATGSYVVLDDKRIMVTIPGTSPAFVAVASGHTGAIVIGIANMTAGVPGALTTSASLTLTYAPVIYAITDTATYVQPSPVGALASFSPYEFISIFGDNFVLPAGSPAIATFDANGKIVNPIAIVPASGTGSTAVKAEFLTVNFVSIGGTVKTYSAPVLYVNQNQINAIVPSQVLTGTKYTVTVGLSGGTVLASDSSVTVAVQDNNPGIFTLASDGTGPGAIVNATGVVNGSVAGAGGKAAAGSVISIYASGLGAPTSVGSDVANNTPVFAPSSSNTCVSVASWFTNVTTKTGTGATAYVPPTPAWTSIDGAAIAFGPHAIITGNYQPCMATDVITATLSKIDGTNPIAIPAANIQYAGWVSGSVAGLYQINALLPTPLTGLTSLGGPVNITLTINGVTSPAVTMVLQ